MLGKGIFLVLNISMMLLNLKTPDILIKRGSS